MAKYTEGDTVIYKDFEIRRSSNDAFGRWMYRPKGGPIDEGVASTLSKAKADIRAMLAYCRGKS